MTTLEAIGKKIGKWTVLSRVKTEKGYDFICKCECGEIKQVRSDNVLSGKSTQCMSCSQKEKMAKKPKKEKSNEPRIIKIRYDSNKEWSEENTFIGTYADFLTACKERRSKREKEEKEQKIAYWQGRKVRDSIYRRYNHMRRRCYNEKDQNYKNYGGRGIKICDEWLNDFETFYKWALENGYKKELTIDRIDVNGNYEPSNCRWITMKEQQRNRRTNVRITFNGVTKTQVEWAEELGITGSTIRDRINKGLPLEKVLTSERLKCENRKPYKSHKKKPYEQTKKYQADKKRIIRRIAIDLRIIQINKLLNGEFKK